MGSPGGLGGLLRTINWPSVLNAEAETRVLPKRMQASDMRYRDAGVSVQSRTRSKFRTMSSAVSGVSLDL